LEKRKGSSTNRRKKENKKKKYDAGNLGGCNEIDREKESGVSFLRTAMRRDVKEAASLGWYLRFVRKERGKPKIIESEAPNGRSSPSFLGLQACPQSPNRD
jgi:hypothetical protein